MLSSTVQMNEFNWTVLHSLMNQVDDSIISVANYEVDNGPEKLKSLLQDSKVPIILSSNLNGTYEEKLLNTPDIIKRSTILTVNGYKIGIIGYVTHYTKKNEDQSDVAFSNEIAVIQKEVKKLERQGVKILIVLSQGGYARHEEIVREVEGIDLVSGGYTNTLHNQTQNELDSEVSEADYPTVVTQKSGRKAYVARAFDNNTHVSNISVRFDGDGEVKYISTHFLNITMLFRNLMEELDMFIEINEKSKCKIGECRFGNCLVDAIASDHTEKTGNLSKIKPPILLVKTETLLNIVKRSSDFNRQNTFFKVKISGKILREILEFSNQNLTGVSLQISGINVTYDLSKPFGSRVVKVYARCFDCENSDLEKLKDDSIYTVIIDELLMNYSEDLYNITTNSEKNIPYEELYELPRSAEETITKNGWKVPSLGRITFINQ